MKAERLSREQKGCAVEPIRPRYIIALDQGTTSSRAVLIDRGGTPCAIAHNEFPQIFPQPGWVEHNPIDILTSQLDALTELLDAHDVQPAEVAAIGITNQRETAIVWNRKTGEPVYNAIVWQCRRTTPLMEKLGADPRISAMIAEKTGLVCDPYFSASKIAWILDNVEGARAAAERGELAFGTVDAWLVWKLTQGAVHATDPTNASRTMLYNIHTGAWDDELLELFGIPRSMMPEVRPSASFFGKTSSPGVIEGIPIMGVAGDQQAALFGQGCFNPGDAKCTYGTGCFLLMNTGTHAQLSRNSLITTVAACGPGTSGLRYALEGSVFMGGALVQWLRDELEMIEGGEEAERLAEEAGGTGGVYVVPAFTGLGAPYWDADARGAIFGLTRGTTRAHIVRACLEALAYQVLDLVRAMESDAGMRLDALSVDGGASANAFLMQFQADIMERTLDRPTCRETTALGAAFLAGLACGFWSDESELRALRTSDDVFHPSRDHQWRRERIDGWNEAVARVRTN
ncbi:glycerol kinase GlpK [Eggerthellaceae bacterium zg-886]|uniref:Glycerol kinase n=1 Tax=Xiamenia xianingshaonis TaxID=2682776 RepID=A0ABX0II45_9ACTN|nr:glycerol kinase GlpK [Xiamenia xianingshaonis]